MKIGLALGGGAARGNAHIGVLKALERMGLKADILCGCSVGAMVAAAYAVGNLGRLENWMRSLTRRQMLHYLEISFGNAALVDVETFNQFLASEVCAEGREIESLDIRFASVATEIRSGKEVWLQTGSILDAVRASIALPGLFRPVADDDGWLVDGGLVNPVPVSICRALGADVVIAVNLNSDLLGRHFSEHPRERGDDEPSHWKRRFSAYTHGWLGELFTNDAGPGLFDCLASSFNIMQDRITRSRMAGDPPDVTIAPRLSSLGLLEFYRADIAIAEGEASVSRMRGEIEHVLHRARDNHGERGYQP
jgi:NTE family protein